MENEAVAREVPKTWASVSVNLVISVQGEEANVERQVRANANGPGLDDVMRRALDQFIAELGVTLGGARVSLTIQRDPVPATPDQVKAVEEAAQREADARIKEANAGLEGLGVKIDESLL